MKERRVDVCQELPRRYEADIRLPLNNGVTGAIYPWGGGGIVSTEIHTKPTNAICGQNLVFLVLILAVNTVTAWLERMTDYICGNDVEKC